MIDKLFIKIAQLDLSPLPTVTGDDKGQAVWDRAIPIVTATLAAVALLLMVINGYMYITASGDPQKTAQARSGLLYAAIGFIVVVSAGIIVTAIVKGIG